MLENLDYKIEKFKEFKREFLNSDKSREIYTNFSIFK